QIKQFQRNNRTLRAEVLYVVLVCEVIPNILTLHNLATNLKLKKEKRQKEFNIMDPSNCKILMQEFHQVAYLEPSQKRDESAKRLLQMKKVIKHEIEQTTGNIYIHIESENIPQLIYMTCVYRKPTEICCQCFDFLQKGIACKHLCAASLYINDLRKQDQYAYLPEIIFATYEEAQDIHYDATYEEAQDICHDLYDNKLKKSESASFVQYNSDDSSTTNNSDRDEEDTDDENNGQKYNKNNANSSNNFFNYMEHIFSISDAPKAKEISKVIDQLNPINITKLHAAAIYKQELKDFLVSTLRSLRMLQDNLIILQALIQSKDNLDNLNTLITYLHDIVTSNSFKEAQNLVDLIYDDTNPHKHITSKTNIIPLKQETKQ
ncbi:11052_t:CDS:1, partial [Cetraspora pellucida]